MHAYTIFGIAMSTLIGTTFAAPPGLPATGLAFCNPRADADCRYIYIRCLERGSPTAVCECEAAAHSYCRICNWQCHGSVNVLKPPKREESGDEKTGKWVGEMEKAALGA
jgi:hypothetical protein